jgi:tetratricopeptide (TPR) repeat protein
VAALFLRQRPENLALADEAVRFWTAENQPGTGDPPLAPRAAPWWTAGLARRRFPWESFGRGNALYGLGLYTAARREYRRALIEAGRDEPALVNNYASANFRLGRLDEARTWYRRLLDLDARNALARERIAVIDARRMRSGSPR